jgi:glycine cleavage system H protein
MNPKFSTQHQWIETGTMRPKVGITPHAQETLGDIVFIQLPSLGQNIDQFAQICVVESVKAAADVFSPASGVVCAVNEALTSDPSLLNSDPLGEGWIYQLELKSESELSSLLSEVEYHKTLD